VQNLASLLSHIRTPRFCLRRHFFLTRNSPLGHGLLTGQIKNRLDLEDGDHRRDLSRFQENVGSLSRSSFTLLRQLGLQNIDHNLQLVNTLSSIANRKGITTAQLCIAWVGSLGDDIIPLPGSS
jgi:pyridoxine 4-dehydrogenase